MTDREVLAVLDRLPPLLAVPVDLANGQAISDWHEAFKLSLAGAERGSQWPEVQARAKVVAVLLSRRVGLLEAAQKAVKRDLDQCLTGGRALSAYRTPTR